MTQQKEINGKQYFQNIKWISAKKLSSKNSNHVKFANRVINPH